MKGERKMTIAEAIKKAKEKQKWNVAPHVPTTVAVLFQENRGQWFETELDLYGEDKETELTELWASLCDEMDSSEDRIVEVKAYGHIVE
jgi:hypothetical protein